jgi:rod shape-determining protein MreD
MIHRRVLWFPPATQALHIFPLLLVMQVVQLVIQYVISAKSPPWYYFIESLTTVALWPVVTWMLLAPQRRSINRDDTRPI